MVSVTQHLPLRWSKVVKPSFFFFLVSGWTYGGLFHTRNLEFQIWPHRSTSTTKFYSERSKKLPEYLQFSVTNLAWKNRRKGTASNRHTQSNTCLTNRLHSESKKRGGGGEGIRWNSVSLDSIWTICSSRLGHILMIKVLISSSILSATQYFHDLLLADLTHYLSGLYYSKDKGLQLKPWSFSKRCGIQLPRCQGKGKRVKGTMKHRLWSRTTWM